MSRFDYVKYDEYAIARQKVVKDMVEDLESVIQSLNHSSHAGTGRACALALTKLEEVYMWAGKAIRDGQIERNGSAELQEQRTNS